VTRIVHVIGGTEIGGTELVLERLVQNLDAARFECIVISLRPIGPVGLRLAADGHRVLSAHVTSAGGVASGFARLQALIRAERPDVVHTWIYHADLLGGLAARLSGRRRIIWSVRQGEITRERNKRSLLWLARSCAVLSRRVPSRITFNSRASEVFHVGLGYDAARCLVIPNGFDTSRFKPDPTARASIRRELSIDDDAPVVGLVGRWDRQKDHANFLAAVALAKASVPGVVAILAGPGITTENRELIELIGAAGLSGADLRLLGAREDVPSVLASFDVAVSSSAGEGLPNSVGEAMATGLQCVATDVGDTRLLLGDAGSLVPPSDPGRLGAAVIEALSRSASARASVGMRARRRIEEEYSLARMVGRYANLYDEISPATKQVSRSD
jgi:glycosyltransferase involved in cell wall biosynthesis